MREESRDRLSLERAICGEGAALRDGDAALDEAAKRAALFPPLPPIYWIVSKCDKCGAPVSAETEFIPAILHVECLKCGHSQRIGTKQKPL
jgi:hypothetical protein